MLEFIERIDKEIPPDDAAYFSERILLYSLIRSIKPTPSVIVETGTHKGLTTLYMAHALWDNGGDGILYTAEPNQEMWGARGNFRKFPELESRIKYCEVKGKDMEVEGKIDFAFIDSEHEKEVVIGEMEHFLPLLSEKAIVVFHDCAGDVGNVGVNAAIEELGLKTVILPTFNTIRIYCHKV